MEKEKEDIIFILDPSYKPHGKFFKELILWPSSEWDEANLKWKDKPKYTRMDQFSENKCPREYPVQTIPSERTRLIKPKTRIEITALKTLVSLYNTTFICLTNIQYHSLMNEGRIPKLPTSTKAVIKFKPIFYGKET